MSRFSGIFERGRRVKKCIRNRKASSRNIFLSASVIRKMENYKEPDDAIFRPDALRAVSLLLASIMIRSNCCERNVGRG